VLFLDEPTSGLDSESAFNVVELCRVMTRIANRTVIMCIHQPTQAMWELFDSAVILSGGRTVYSGATRDLKPYFAVCLQGGSRARLQSIVVNNSLLPSVPCTDLGL